MSVTDPPSQSRQVSVEGAESAADVVSLNLPGAHSSQLLLCATNSNPGSHWHADDDVDPSSPPVPDDPLGHESHAATPLDALYLPDAHAAHTSETLAIVPVYPGSQKQSVTDVEPATAVELCGHEAHATCEEELYFPATQVVQVTAPGCPSVSVVDPAGQASHVTF